MSAVEIYGAVYYAIYYGIKHNFALLSDNKKEYGVPIP